MFLVSILIISYPSYFYKERILSYSLFPNMSMNVLQLSINSKQ